MFGDDQPRTVASCENIALLFAERLLALDDDVALPDRPGAEHEEQQEQACEIERPDTVVRLTSRDDDEDFTDHVHSEPPKRVLPFFSCVLTRVDQRWKVFSLL